MNWPRVGNKSKSSGKYRSSQFRRSDVLAYLNSPSRSSEISAINRCKGQWCSPSSLTVDERHWQQSRYRTERYRFCYRYRNEEHKKEMRFEGCFPWPNSPLVTSDSSALPVSSLLTFLTQASTALGEQPILLFKFIFLQNESRHRKNTPEVSRKSFRPIRVFRSTVCTLLVALLAGRSHVSSVSAEL